MTPEEARVEIASALPDLVSGDTAKSTAAEQRIVSIISAQEDLPRPETQARFNAAQSRFNAARDETVATARSAADKAADGAAGASYIAFAALLAGAVAAALGGAVRPAPAGPRVGGGRQSNESCGPARRTVGRACDLFPVRRDGFTEHPAHGADGCLVAGRRVTEARRKLAAHSGAIAAPVFEGRDECVATLSPKPR